MGWFGGQLRQVLRRLRRAPAFTLVTILTLAVGIGANTAIFSVLEGVLLKPLAYPRPEELVAVWHTAPGINVKDLEAAPSNYFTYRDENRTFQDIGLWADDTVSVTGVAEPEQVPARVVTDGTLPILGVRPLLGRWFTRKDDLPGSPETVMLTYGYWRSRFGGDPGVIGRRIVVDAKAREVIGVMPQRFRFTNAEPALILPFQFDRNKTQLGNFSYRALARLKPGATMAQASADVGRMLPIVLRKFPAPLGLNVKLFEEARIAPNLRPLKQDVVGDVGKVLWVLMGTIGMVLLIACASVANLLLVRAEGRQQELAVKAALGASRGRIASELLMESLMLGALGGAIGLGLALGALRLLVALAPAGLPRLEEIGMDAPVLLFTLAVSLLAGALFGSIPVFKHAGARFASALRSSGRGMSQSRERHRARSALVVVQVALALVLLISSGLMIRTLRALMNVHPGFVRPSEVQTLSISIPEAQVRDGEQVARMQEAMLRKVAEIPGVVSAALSSSIPMDGGGSWDPVSAQDRTYSESEIPPIRRFKFVSPGLLRTLGTPLVSGRDFTWTDIDEKRPVALVSENMAREYWGGPAAALGKRIRVGPNDEWREVVGVAADVRDHGVNQKAPTIVYWPILMKKFWGNDIMVRRTLAFAIRSSRTGSESFLKEVRQAVWSVNANLPVAEVRTLDEIYRKSMARTSFTLVMLGIAGAMALLLGVVGIYGVIAYSVSQRTREIGVRMALGARQQELAGMFVWEGLRLTGIGVVCGLVAAAGLTRLMTSLLFEVSPADPITYGAVSVGLAATATLASYVPSRRAAGVDPVEALRGE